MLKEGKNAVKLQTIWLRYFQNVFMKTKIAQEAESKDLYGLEENF